MKLVYGDLAAREVSGRIGKVCATVADMTAVPADRREDGQLFFCQADGRLYAFNLNSTATANADIKAPDSGSGRFEAMRAASATASVRGVVFANVANLASFTVAGNDGLTYVEGQRVLLANQTTAAQCGIYVVGAVGGGTAALTRATDLPSGATLVNGMVVEVSEGTLFAGSSWKAMATGSVVIGTTDPAFYPRHCKGILTLASGTKTLGATEGLFLFSTTKSMVNLQLDTPATVTNTVQYQCAVAGRVAGKSGTGALVAQANVAAGTINAADNSTLMFLVTNW